MKSKGLIDFKKISSTEVGYGIYLDWVLHFIGGVIITIILRKFLKLDFLKTCIILLIVALAKEIYDSSTLTYNIYTSIPDVIATFIYPAISYSVYKSKKSLEERE